VTFFIRDFRCFLAADDNVSYISFVIVLSMFVSYYINIECCLIALVPFSIFLIDEITVVVVVVVWSRFVCFAFPVIVSNNQFTHNQRREFRFLSTIL
jgi:hypothetical protein